MKNKIKPIKGYWIRNGNESFLISNVYMNRKNAELVCRGRNLPANNNVFKEYKVIPVLITPLSITSKAK